MTATRRAVGLGFLAVGLCHLLTPASAGAQPARDGPIDFDRQIRPILADN